MAREITATTRALPRFEERAVRVVSLRSMIISRFLRHRMAVVGLVVESFLILYAFVGPFLSPYEPDAVNLRERFAPPSAIMLPQVPGEKAIYNMAAIEAATPERALKFGHPLGTDDLGRDTMTRAMYGGRVPLGIAFLAGVLAIFAAVRVAVMLSPRRHLVAGLAAATAQLMHAVPDLGVLMLLIKIIPP